jgi:hypothetical protein
MRIRLVAIALLLAAIRLPAQGRPIDEGTLILTRAGAPVGTETFRVVAVGNETAGQMKLTGQRSVGEQRTSTSLLTDSLGTPASYALSVKDGRTEVFQLTAQGAPGRLASIWRDQQRNESMKEFVVTPGTTVILDDDLCQHFALVGLHRRSGQLKIIVPRTGREFSETLAPAGMESIEVGGRAVTATKYGLGAGRQFWIDAAGRLLRVVLPNGITATREELPR